MTISELQHEAHETAISKGWYEGHKRTVPELIALCHSEVSGALEECRNGPVDFGIFYRQSDGKPEGLGIELADAVIRIADMAEYLGVNLEECVRIKAAFNKTRPYRHGGKAA